MKPLLAQLQIEITLTLRRGEGLLVTFLLPLGLLLFFGTVAPLPSGDVRPLDFLVPGVLALAVMSTSMVALSIATGFERYYGVLKRLLGSPLGRGRLMLAKALAILTLQVAQVGLILLVAYLVLGWQPGGSLLVGLPVLVLGSLAFAGIGLLMAGTLRAEATLALSNGLYLLFMLVGGFIFPLDQLPPVLETVARVLPAAAFSEATRAALLGRPQDLAVPLAVLALWAVGSVTAAARFFRAE